MHTDRELIEQIQRGDTEQFRHIISRYKDQVAATIAGMIGTENGFEEIGQEVFVRFFKAINKFRFQSTVATYLTRIAINLTVNEIKRKQRFRQRFVPLDENTTHKDLGEDIDFSEEMLHYLDALPGKFRSTITLRYLHGYDSAGASDILEITEGAFRTRLSRALALLRTVIEKEMQQ